MMSSLQHLVDTYGYVVVLIGTFLEGETILVLGGLAARLGYLKLQWVIVAAFAGSMAGDQLYFYLGRRHGKTLLARHPAWEGRVAKIHNLMERFETPLLLGFRFLYGFRSLTPLVIGMSRIKLWKFFILNMLGAAIWATCVASLGYALGHSADRLLGDIKRYELEAMIVVVVVGAAAWTVYIVRKRIREHVAKQVD
ncbi:MAG: DedA family protein [Gammaproteobacteria bacterium]|nr:DedA family protein [Gammaproteobacteria bacterium]